MTRKNTLGPIEITINNPGTMFAGKLKVETRDFQSSLWSTEDDVTLQPGANTVYSTIQSYSGFEQVRVTLETKNGRALASTNTSIQSPPNETSLVAGFGESTNPLSSLYQTKYTYNGPDKAGRTPVATIGAITPAKSSDIEKFRPGTLAALDSVILCGFLPREASPVSLQTLKDYALSGGLLIVSATPDTGIFAHPFYRQILPGSVTGASQATGGGRVIFKSAFVPDKTANEYKLTGGISIWIKQYGRGAVCFLPVDISQPTVQNLPYFRQMAAEMMAEASSYQKPPITLFDNSSTIRYQDLAAVPRSDPPSLQLVGLFLVGYLTVLVPVNFAILKKRDQKEKTWLTTPLIIASFTLIAYLISLLIRGGDFNLHQIAISDYTSGDGSAQKHVIAGFFANSTDDFRLEGPRGGYFLTTSAVNNNVNPWEQRSQIEQSLISSSGLTDNGVYQDIRSKMWTPQITRFSQTVNENAPLTGSIVVSMGTVSGTLDNTQNRDWEQVWIVADGRTYKVGDKQSGRNIPVRSARVNSPIAPSELTNENKVRHQMETAVYNTLQEFPYKEGAYVVAFDEDAKPMLEMDPRPDSVKVVEAVIARLDMTSTIVNREVHITMTRSKMQDSGNAGGFVRAGAPDTISTGPGASAKVFYSATVISSNNLKPKSLDVVLNGTGNFRKSTVEALESGTMKYVRLSSGNSLIYPIPPPLSRQKSFAVKVVIPPGSELSPPAIRVRY